MKVAYTGRKPQDVPYRFVPDLKALAAASDFLVVACPGGAATKNIVDADVLAALGKKGTIVNIARGSIVDEPALVAALQTGTIKGAGLDVFADEPNIPPPLLRDGQRRAAAARRQRDARDAAGDGRPVQGESRRVVRGQAAADADSRARLSAAAPADRGGAPVVRRRPAAPRLRRPQHGEHRRDDERQRAHSLGARALAQHQHAGEHADDRHRQRRHRRHRDRQRAREREPRPVRERARRGRCCRGSRTTRAPDVERAASGPGSKNGASERDRQPARAASSSRTACSAASAASTCAAARCRAPTTTAAPRISSAPIGRALDVADVVAEQQRHAEHAERRGPTILRFDSGSCSSSEREQHAPDRHRVGEDRAAPRRQLLHAEQHEAVPAGDVEAARARRPCPSARAECGSRRRRASRRRAGPSAANGSVSARNVSGASSATPIFSTGQLQPQTSVRTTTGTSASRSQRARDRCRRSRAVRASGSRSPAHRSVSPYLLWCSARACVTQASRRMRPGNSGSRASNSSMSRSVQRAIWR